MVLALVKSRLRCKPPWKPLVRVESLLLRVAGWAQVAVRVPVVVSAASAVRKWIPRLVKLP